MAEIVKQEYKLDEKAIGEITGFMEKWFTEHKIQHKNRSVFILESMLCDINDHYQEPVDITVGVVTRFGYSNIIVTYNGEAFNPVEGEEGSPQTQYFMTRMGFIPTYSYKNKKNLLTLEIPGNNLKQETLLLIAVIGAIILGVVGSALPEEIVLFVSEYILSTVSTIFMNLLGIFSGILIFLSLVSGICGMGSVSELSFKGKYMLTKLVKTMVIWVVIMGIALIPFFNFTYGNTGIGGGIKDIYNMLMGIIPSNPVSPFMDGNMMQIVVISVFVGGMIIILGNKVEQVRKLVLQGNTLFISLVEAVCKMLPLYILADLTRLFWTSGMEVLFVIWKPMILCLAANILIVLLKFIKVSVQYKVSLPLLMKKIRPSFIIGLTTASSMAAFGTMLEVNEKKLGIDADYNSFSIPLKNQLHVLNGAVGFTVIVYFLVEYNGISINEFWFLSVWIMMSLLNLAIPPVSGGALIGVNVIMEQFNIPTTCLGMAASMVLLFDFLTTAAKVAIIHLESVEEADHLNILNREVLLKE